MNTNYDNEKTITDGLSTDRFVSATAKTDKGYLVEMAIPFGIAPFKNGQVLGFDVQVNDDGTGDGKRTTISNWNDLTGMGYTVKEYTFADSNDVAQVTQSACGENEVLYIPTDNTAASCTEAIDNVAAPAGIPIVCGEEGICKGCGVATLSISYYDLGVATGEMAYDVLVNGADVSTMDVQFAPNVTYEYVAERCEALNITVPEDYTAISTEE